MSASSRVSSLAAVRRPGYEIDVGERLTVPIPDDVAGVGLLDDPGRREAPFGLVDRRTIADPRLQAAQRPKVRRRSEMRVETPALGMRCRGLSARGRKVQSPAAH